MTDAVPEPVFPEEDAYPAYRMPAPIVAEPADRLAEMRERIAIDKYVLTAIVATNTVRVPHKYARRITEL
jgi:hypothetical protein